MGKKRDDKKWNERLAELKQYRQDKGNCNVPNKYNPNQQLANWIKFQRQLYKKNKLLPQRALLLNGMEFEWVVSVDALGRTVSVSWDERYSQLIDYKEKIGNCKVAEFVGQLAVEQAI